MKKKVFLFGLLFSLLLLCGCGVNLTSTVKLNKDFSGTRVMSCTFSSRDFHSYFKGSKEDLNKLIKESCPDALTYTSSSSDGNDTYTFYLRFSSLDDYKKKVRDLLNFSPEITYEYGDSPFVSGLIYKENFTSKDLMTWLYTALYEGKYIDKDSSSDLWDLKSQAQILASQARRRWRSFSNAAIMIQRWISNQNGNSEFKLFRR